MAIILEVKVAPSSGKNKWIIDKGGKLKCYLKNPPERGLANDELISLIAKALRLPKLKIDIISGQSSRNKRVKIDFDISLDELFKILGVENIDLGGQKDLFTK